MITKLEQLTIARFIDLLCGDMSVIANKADHLSPKKVAIALRNIILEFKEIADPAGTKSYFSYIDDLIKAKTSNIIFTMCRNMIELKALDNVRLVLGDYGIDTSRMDDNRLIAEIKSRLQRAKKDIADLESEHSVAKQNFEKIRAEFDKQTADLMAYYKFQIDTTSMGATVYAHLIARHNKEIKAKMAAMKKYKH